MAELQTYYTCWGCDRQSERQPITAPIPDGWREASRGKAGTVHICPHCNKAGKKHKKDK